jgi:FkbM family methyltransferase
MNKLRIEIKKTRRKLIARLHPYLFDLYENSFAFLKQYPHRVDSTPDGKLIRVRDHSDQFFICRRTRVSLYKRGIERRLTDLMKTYHLDKIPEPLSGAFIDCGANVGELGAFSRAKGLDYHAFEPEPLEADCCDQNNFQGKRKTNRVGLWSEDGTMTFYSKPSTADSSLFETDGYHDRHTLNVRSLDSFTAENGIDAIAVIKIEAEGAEPEILIGASESLKRARYVTVDCGFERGRAQESTLVPVINFMLTSGFEAVAWNKDRVTMLFRNNAFIV